MILAKSCHDFDILLWLAGNTCIELNSYGELGHFTAANAPEGRRTAAIRDARWSGRAPIPRNAFTWKNFRPKIVGLTT